MRYTDIPHVLEVIQSHREGITAKKVTSEIWPDRIGSDYEYSYIWVKNIIQTLKKRGSIEAGAKVGREIVWRVKQ